ncbi:hypothetical protein [uncultured Thiodictyon sp.]|uniref:hypothetical protein n=1 Tax=uncultured Thiodictyon sp. TaxID=1846217 RepID=UPI0025F5159E|nr:hypothetical protein [uncultured Thiodictyon sp.]
MKLCSKCDNSPLPFIMIFVIATISAFMTWLTLELSIPEVGPRAGASAVVFAVVGGLLLAYVLNCLKHHCRHQDEHAHDGADHRAPVRP